MWRASQSTNGSSTYAMSHATKRMTAGPERVSTTPALRFAMIARRAIRTSQNSSRASRGETTANRRSGLGSLMLEGYTTAMPWAYDERSPLTLAAGAVWRTRMDLLKARRGPRPSWLLLLALPLLLTACNQVGGASLTFWDIVWGMVFFFFWFMAIWIFINIFADIFRRDDMTGASKVIWLIALIFLPFLGALIYLLTRPKVTAQDVSLMAKAEAGQKAVAQVSTADELTKLAQLKDAGVITEAQYEDLKAKLLA